MAENRKTDRLATNEEVKEHSELLIVKREPLRAVGLQQNKLYVYHLRYSIAYRGTDQLTILQWH